MSDKIFAGLKVLDFTWAASGPILVKQLADNGAHVVKVESARHPDSVRLGGPFKDDRPGLNRSGFFADFNSSKLGIAVDTNHPRAAEIIDPLVAWADVVAESFRPGVMEKWGFGYERLKEINPRIVYVSSSLYGADGPWARHPGYGSQGAALAGLHGLTGWADRPPAAPKGAYTDSISPRFAAAALVAALIHRERTGQGQRVELSQIEASVTFMTPELLQYQTTGVAPERCGNRDPSALLHGVLPCRGTDRWVAIEVRTPQQWAALDGVVGLDGVPVPSPAGESEDEAQRVEAAVAARTAGWDAFALAAALRSAGVPAAVALKGSDLLEDEVLQARDHFRPLDHAEMGRLHYNGPAYRFETTPSELVSAAPRLGEHTDRVLSETLHLTPAEIAAYREDGVLT